MLCTDHAGTPADTLFVAQHFHSGAPTHNEAYLAGNNPTAERYQPDPTYDFNSTGTPDHVFKVAGPVGQYAVLMPGMVSASNVTVTAYGTDGNYCNILDWLPPQVEVQCYTPAGVPADGFWTLHATNQSVGNNGHKGAYLTADQPTAAAYTPDPDFQWNSTGAANTVTRSTTGTYQVLIPGLAAVNATNAIVTAQATNDSCSVNGWGASGTGTVVNILCHNPAGNLANSPFALSYLTNF